MPVNPRIPRALYALAVIDLFAGAWLLGWPGAWQEVMHPLAMGTVFYPIQRQGAAWFGRAGLALWAARRPGPLPLALLAGAWAIEVPAAALVAWRTGGIGRGWWIHGLLALFAAGIAWCLWRAARGDTPSAYEEDGEHGSAT